jgi:hypothetical protein
VTDYLDFVVYVRGRHLIVAIELHGNCDGLVLNFDNFLPVLLPLHLIGCLGFPQAPDGLTGSMGLGILSNMELRGNLQVN